MIDEDPDHEIKRERDEINLLYSTGVAEITAYKRQQWHVANYATLLFAAIAGSPRLLARPLLDIELAAGVVFAITIAAAGTYVIEMLGGSILERRHRLTYIRRNHFHEATRIAWRHGLDESERKDIPEEKMRLQWFFRMVLLAGLVTSLWLFFNFSARAA